MLSLSSDNWIGRQLPCCCHSVGLAKKISAVMWLYTEATCHSRLTKPCGDKLRAIEECSVKFAFGYLSSALVTLLIRYWCQPHHHEAYLLSILTQSSFHPENWLGQSLSRPPGEASTPFIPKAQTTDCSVHFQNTFWFKFIHLMKMDSRYTNISVRWLLLVLA